MPWWLSFVPGDFKSEVIACEPPLDTAGLMVSSGISRILHNMFELITVYDNPLQLFPQHSTIHNTSKSRLFKGFQQNTFHRHNVKHTGILQRRRKAVGKACLSANLTGTGSTHAADRIFLRGVPTKNQCLFKFGASVELSPTWDRIDRS